jgi:pyrimidine operon attenuation protein/uracil phosphoribosyltransferase
MKQRTLILDAEKVNQKIKRIAHEILEKNYPSKSLVLIGIKGQGLDFAASVQKELKKIDKSVYTELLVLPIDKKNPIEQKAKNVFEGKLKHQNVLLFDDVLNSGRTLMYACSSILQEEVKTLQTVILVNRHYRKFPIRADIVGLTLNTTMQEHIAVEKTGNEMLVYLE